MPRKLRVPKERIEGVSEIQLYFLSDGLLGTEDQSNDFDLFLLRGDDKAIQKLWSEHREAIMAEWIHEHPGTRPSLWWKYDAPRMTAGEVEARGWTGWYFTPTLCEPRLRLGGSGIPRHECLNYVPSFRCGVPDLWISEADVDDHDDIQGVPPDPRDPPKFESQAQYLRRHNLLEPGEARRLKARDFEPETIPVPVGEDQEEATIQ